MEVKKLNLNNYYSNRRCSKCNIHACSCKKIYREQSVLIGPIKATGLPGITEPVEPLLENRIYVANFNSNTVSVIDGATNTVIATIPVGINPAGVDVNPLTDRIYVANRLSDTVSVIDGVINTVIATVPVGDEAGDAGVNIATNAIYTANFNSLDSTEDVTVISGLTNTVIATIIIPGLNLATGIGANPLTNRIYVANFNFDTVSVIDGATNIVITNIPVQVNPFRVGINPDTNRIYVSNFTSNTVSVIDGVTNLVIATVPVGITPAEVGVNTEM